MLCFQYTQSLYSAVLLPKWERTQNTKVKWHNQPQSPTCRSAGKGDRCMREHEFNHQCSLKTKKRKNKKMKHDLRFLILQWGLVLSFIPASHRLHWEIHCYEALICQGSGENAENYLSTSGSTPCDIRTSIIFFITAPCRHGCTDACFPGKWGWSSIVTCIDKKVHTNK